MNTQKESVKSIQEIIILNAPKATISLDMTDSSSTSTGTVNTSRIEPFSISTFVEYGDTTTRQRYETAYKQTKTPPY